MLELNSKDVRFLARMGARGTLGQVLFDYLKDGNEAYLLSADLATASGFERISRNFPDRVINVGIAEQNMLGIAAGMACADIPIVATSWAMFSVVRAADQVRNYMGYMRKNIKLIGMDSGFMQSKFSYSHSNPPDIAFIRSIPGIAILSPCDGVEIYKVMQEALKHNGPVYIRLTGDSYVKPIYSSGNIDFKIGGSVTLKKGQDIAIVATGNIVSNAISASTLLEENYGISVEVIDMYSVEPLDYDKLKELMGFKYIITLEEHLKRGGLGSAISEFFVGKEFHPQIINLGVDNFYPPNGSVEFVEEECGISVDQIVKKVICLMR